MKGYKAFKKGMVCQGKQYAENTTFEEDSAIICQEGMHFCKEPLEVLEYYPLVDDNGEQSEFAEVEALGNVVTDDDKKFCTNRLKIGTKLNFSKLVQLAVKFDYKKINNEKKAQIGLSGDWAKIGSSGDWAKIGSSGDWAQIGSSGDWAKIGSSGDGAQIGSSGDWAKIGSSGDGAVIMCAGRNSCAKGKIGSWITLAEWKYDNHKDRYIPTCVKTKRIDGVKLKEDTFYTLKNGEFIEVEENNNA